MATIVLISKNKLILILILISLLSFEMRVLGVNYTALGNGNWEDNTTAMWSTVPDNGTLNGNISSYPIDVSGNVIRNGNLNVGGALTIKNGGTLTVNGMLTGNNPININNGGTLIVKGDLISSGLSIVISPGGTLVVYGNTTINGGSWKVDGNFVTVGNFSMTSISATLENNGNILVGGNFTFSNGSLTLVPPAKTTSPISERIYFVNPDAVITQPSDGSSPVCLTTDPICRYGTASDLAAKDPDLLAYITNLLGCIFVQPTSYENVCVGASTTITVESLVSGVTYQWEVSTDGGNSWQTLSNTTPYSGVTSSKLVISPVATMSNYKYRCKLAGGCSAVSNICTLNSTSYTSAPASLSFCNSNTALISLSVNVTGGTYQWEKSSDGASWSSVPSSSPYSGVATSNLTIAAYGISSSTYFRLGITSCSSKQYSSNLYCAIVSGAPSYSSVSGNSSQCSGLTNQTYSISSSTGATLYTWSVPSDWVITSGQGTFSISVTTGTSSGTVGVVTSNLCGSSSQSSWVNISGVANTATLTSGSNSQSICLGNAISTIKYTTTGATGIGSPTNLPSGLTASFSSNVITISGTPLVNGTFNFQIPLTGGCGSVSATGTIIVNAIPLAPTISVSGSTTICLGTSITLTASGATSYSWTGGVINGVAFIPISTGTYTVIGTTNGCSSLASKTIVVNSRPTVSVGSTNTVCTGEAIVLSATVSGGSPAYVYSWSGPNAYSVSTISATIPNATSIMAGIYSLSVTDANGCASSASLTVYINKTPTTGFIYRGPNK